MSRKGTRAAWPLALLSLAIGSSAWATGFNVTTGADAGAGSLRSQLAIDGIAFVDSQIDTITLASSIDSYNGHMAIFAVSSLNITGPGLAGNHFTLALNGASSQQRLSTTISGVFQGVASGPSGNSGPGTAGADASTPGMIGGVGGIGTYTPPVTAGAAAITGSNFDITNNANVFGGQGTTSVALGNGGTGGNGGAMQSSQGTGGVGGTGGAGASGGAGSAGGAGIAANHFSVVNNATIQGGNGSAGVLGGSGGLGGKGGDGLLNSTTKYGGSGGRGGNGGNGGSGGTGGAGIVGSNMVIVNKGTIYGGSGGVAGNGGAGGNGGPGGLNGLLNTPTAASGGTGTQGQQGAVGAGGVGIVATGNTIIRNAGTISGGQANGGTGPRANAIELSGGNNKLVLEENSVINGNVVSTSSNVSDVLALGGDTGADNILDLDLLGGQYSGFGKYEKEGSNTWSLTGYDSTGKNWDVTAGTLILTDNAELSGSVNINTPGTFRASDGFIAGHLFNEGKLVLETPASGVSELYIGGSFSQSSQGTLQISVLSDSQYSKLYMDGDAYLDGTLNIDVKQGNTLARGNILTDIIRTDGTITGQFSAVTDNSLLFNFTPTYHIDSVNLSVVADNDGSSGGGNSVSNHVQAMGNSPARGAAQVLDGVFASNPTGRLASYFFPLSSSEEVSRAVSESLPMVSGSSEAARTALNGINGVVQARSEQVRGLSSGDVAFTDQHLWIKPFGSWADQESRGGVPGVNTSVGGLAFGLDASLNERWMLGTAFVYANADTRNSGDSARQSLKTDVYQLVGYGTYHLGDNTDLNFQIDGGQNHNEGKRDIDFAGLKAKSNYDSWTAHAGVSLDHTISLGTATRFTPSVRADYTWIKDEAYSEKGAEDLNLKAKSRTTDQFILGVDGKLSHDLTQQLNVSGNLGVGYDFLADKDSITSSFAGAPGASFTTYGGDAQRWLVRGGTGLTYKVSDRVQVGVRYDLEKRSDYLNQTASAEARWAF